MNLVKDFTRKTLGLVLLSSPLLINSQALANDTADTAQNEKIRRQQLELDADSIVFQAKKSLDAAAYNHELIKSFEDAMAKYQLASKGNPDVLLKYESTKNLLTQVQVRWADKLYQQAKTDRAPETLTAAKLLLRDAGKHNPNMLRKYNELIAEYNDLIEEYTYDKKLHDDVALVGADKIALISRGRVDKAQLLYEKRLFIQCRDLLDDVLLDDKFNADATHLLKRVNTKIQLAAKERKRTYKKRALDEITWKWVDPIITAGADGTNATTAEAGENDKLSKVQRKLQNIIFPRIKFEGESLEKVIAEIRERSRALDVDGEGINLLLLLNQGGNAAAAAPADQPVDDAFAGGGDPFGGGDEAPIAGVAPAAGGISKATPVVLEVDDIPLGDLLNTLATAYGLHIKVEEHLIYVHDNTSSKLIKMNTEVFKISAGLVEIVAEHTGSIIDPGATTSEGPRNWKRWFEDNGIPFPLGAKVKYIETVNRLVVTNTSDNLSKAREIIRELDIQVSQVMIEAKIVDVDINSVEELGVMWRYNTQSAAAHPFTGDLALSQSNTGRTDPASPRLDNSMNNVREIQAPFNDYPVQLAADVILGNQQLQMLIRALDQSNSSTLMLAPKALVKSGNTAVVRVVQERYFPENWTDAVIRGDVQFPSFPEYGESQDIGMVLDVTPSVDDDNRTIDLTLSPQVVEFIEYDTTLDREVSNGNGNTMQFRYSMAVTQIRDITDAHLKIWDGETVTLGGLVREKVYAVNDGIPYIEDIPLIGRLFKNQGEIKEKTSLLFFVTARLINDHGNPLNKVRIPGLPDFKR